MPFLRLSRASLPIEQAYSQMLTNQSQNERETHRRITTIDQGYFILRVAAQAGRAGLCSLCNSSIALTIDLLC